jgi:hypothetical protein
MTCRSNGKSTLAAAWVAALLLAGKTVAVATPAGVTLRKRHSSGLVIITPVRPGRSRLTRTPV